MSIESNFTSSVYPACATNPCTDIIVHPQFNEIRDIPVPNTGAGSSGTEDTRPLKGIHTIAGFSFSHPTGNDELLAKIHVVESRIAYAMDESKLIELKEALKSLAIDPIKTVTKTETNTYYDEDDKEVTEISTTTTSIPNHLNTLPKVKSSWISIMEKGGIDYKFSFENDANRIPFKTFSRRYHPDKSTDPRATEMFQQFQETFTSLERYQKHVSELLERFGIDIDSKEGSLILEYGQFQKEEVATTELNALDWFDADYLNLFDTLDNLLEGMKA